MRDMLLVVACMLLTATIVLYMRNIIAKGVTPNPVTFFIRLVVSIFNCFSYFEVVHRDNLKTSVTVISAIGLLVIFSYAAAKGKFTKLNWVDRICAIAASIIGILWRLGIGGDIVANLLLQGVMLLAFWPSIDGVLAGRSKEKPLPWVCATLCYVAMVLAILMDWKTGSAYQLVHPIVSGIFGNGALTAAVLWSNRKKD